MKRELLIAVSAATIVAGVAGCSKDNQASGPSSSAASSGAATSSSAAPATGSTPAASGETKVIVGGKPQPVSGPVVCSTNEGKFSIAVGDMATGIIVGLEQDGSAVHNAGFGTVDGVVMSFTEGVPGNDAKATKTGNSYQITGHASGMDNAGQQVNKPFEVDVTCP
ncbi:lipoprotein LpqH [Mycobacterium sp.]|uniref:lipoprotein LpqH n=1 Tax=Mycobacterium sp. TaxID=1785 RepID=UPI002C6B6354|nr:lipoprotein LpqH [Mycobacterium sp.]HTQ20711.1 lipoprotein LpqH [Mycobacterium sp.]